MKDEGGASSTPAIQVLSQYPLVPRVLGEDLNGGGAGGHFQYSFFTHMSGSWARPVKARALLRLLSQLSTCGLSSMEVSGWSDFFHGGSGLYEQIAVL